MDDTYERILCNIHTDDAEYALRALRWLAFSDRPLYLDEVAEVMAIDPEREVPFDADEVLEDPLDVLSICSSLVTITSLTKDQVPHGDRVNSTDDRAVALAHYSVQEYLLSERCLCSKASQYALNPAVSNSLIMEGCISCLMHPFRLDAPDEQQRKPRLSIYSARYWVSHASSGQETNKSTERIVKFILSHNVYAGWIGMLDLSDGWQSSQLDSKSTAIGFYHVCHTGLTQTAIRLLELGNIDVNTHGGRLGDALTAASSNNHQEVMALLLNHGAEVNGHGGLLGSPLQAAAAAGHDEAVRMLVNKDADVNQEGGHYGNALQAAAAGGYERIMNMLLDQGASVNKQGGIFGCALQAAAAFGHSHVVMLLLDRGAKVTIRGGYYSSPIAAAVRRDNKQMVELLLGRAEPSAITNVFVREALWFAAARGSEKIVQMLLARAEDEDTQSEFRAEALNGAATFGAQEIFDTVENRTMDTGKQDASYVDAIQKAAGKGRIRIVEMLLNKGVHIDSPGGFYGSTVQAAAGEGHDSTVEFLLQKGADVNLQGGWFGGPLHAAAASAKPETVKLLLNKGADPALRSPSGWLPLEVALVRGRLEIVKVLGEAMMNDGHGPSVDRPASTQEMTVKELLRNVLSESTSVNGWSLLHWTCRTAKASVVRLLLELGLKDEERLTFDPPAEWAGLSIAKYHKNEWLKSSDTQEKSSWYQLFDSGLLQTRSNRLKGGKQHGNFECDGCNFVGLLRSWHA